MMKKISYLIIVVFCMTRCGENTYQHEQAISILEKNTSSILDIKAILDSRVNDSLNEYHIGLSSTTNLFVFEFSHKENISTSLIQNDSLSYLDRSRIQEKFDYSSLEDIFFWKNLYISSIIRNVELKNENVVELVWVEDEDLFRRIYRDFAFTKNKNEFIHNIKKNKKTILEYSKSRFIKVGKTNLKYIKIN